MKFQTKKSLGQHFLRSEGALIKIIDSANLKKADVVLEIGPGEGVLTEKLLAVTKKVIAIEKDRRLIEILNEKFKREIKTNKLVLIEKDILDIDLKKTIKTDYKVVANVPYYISGLLIRFFLETKQQPKSATLLLQKEVVERIISKDKKESILSMSVKVYGNPIFCGVVKAGSFVPPPKVDSAILHVENISKNFFTHNKINEKKIFEILHAGFAHKRKFTSSNLKKKGFKYPATLDPQKRSENLTLADWLEIIQAN